MVSVALPRWTPPADADPELVAEWAAWHGRLRWHEQGHVDVVHAFATGAEERLRAAGCAGIDAEGAAMMAGVRRAQADYDAATGSGHAQGARFWTGTDALAWE
jgi:predicted secreted Zn-dependent protease